MGHYVGTVTKQHARVDRRSRSLHDLGCGNLGWVWTHLERHNTSFVDSVPFFYTPPNAIGIERFGCGVEHVSTD